jgi:hypothetical protein
MCSDGNVNLYLFEDLGVKQRRRQLQYLTKRSTAAAAEESSELNHARDAVHESLYKNRRKSYDKKRNCNQSDDSQA